ncbi:MAG TPA: glycosyl hydrolase family 2 [Terriglobales bacterium]
MSARPEFHKLLLAQNWQLQSSCEVKATGAEISQAGFSTTGWHKAAVPTTVVAALIADGTYPDPSYGMNLKSLPGMDYPPLPFFALQSMPTDSPFRCSWWFRTEFSTQAGSADGKTWLHFDGINYRANVWLNGEKIADAQDFAGMLRVFEFDVSKHLISGKPNALAIEVFAPEKTDLGTTWVDWNPTPADKNMGLWKDVYLTNTGDIALRHPFVASKLAADYKSAALTIAAELHNRTAHPVTTLVRAEIEGVRISQTVELAASESKTITFSPEQYPQLHLAHPRLWWPYQMGKPEMYTADLRVETDGKISDATAVRFGIREVTSQLTDKNYRLFKINGNNLLIRGAAWSPDIFLRWSYDRAAAAMDYTRAMNLNAIRLEGRMEREEFFDMADRLGILLMPGFTCCDFWQQGDEWLPETYKIAGASLTDQLTRLRNHPSVFVWLNGSDEVPPPKIESMYLQIEKETEWPNPTLSSANDETSTLSGPSGVKMPGPYEYVPPNYWYTDKKGGAFGFNTETSSGAVIPLLESLKKFIPADHLWPIGDYWNYHAGLEHFTNIDRFITGLDGRYGKAADLPDFLRKSFAANYESSRAMFEAYGRNKYDSTGVIHWMLNNAWPSIIWHLYDYYLVPSAAYFGTKKACEPLHVQYSYDDNSVVIVNGYDRAFDNLSVKATTYGINSKATASDLTVLDVAADSTIRALQLKPVDGLTPTYFLKLELRDRSGKLVSENFYWLSTKPDVIDWANSVEDYYTPESAFADLTALNSLPPVKLKTSSRITQSPNETIVHALIENPSSSVAFMARFRLADKNNDDIVPIFWDDNYVSLLPGEKREVTASFAPSESKSSPLTLTIDGWNVAPITIPLTVKEKN